VRDVILEKLKYIEKRENISILLAVESGSRAWGFASTDSDYDVRFIYVRPKDWYLKLERTRDVIELSINDILDINGWDLDKTLRLLHSSNPTLFEWFSSPIVYMETEFADHFRSIITSYFSSKRGLYHYLSMASGNYREYLHSDMVKAKKYFYVLRPILACRWIIDRGTPPPMLFAELMDTELEECLKPSVEQLLGIKMNTPEVKEIPRVDILNHYIDISIPEIRETIEAMPEEENNGWEELNALFLSELERV
jgi:predicted nucleotidyltransferase